MREWHTVVPRELHRAVDRDTARRRAAGELDPPRWGGVGSVSPVLGMVLGSVALVLARGFSDVGWDGSTVLFVGGVIDAAGVVVMHVLEAARARSAEWATRDGGGPLSVGLGLTLLVGVAFAIGRLATDEFARDAVGWLGFALVLLAVGGCALLVVRAVRARPRLTANEERDRRAARELRDAQEAYGAGRLPEARVPEVLDGIRSRWADGRGDRSRRR